MQTVLHCLLLCCFFQAAARRYTHGLPDHRRACNILHLRMYKCRAKVAAQAFGFHAEDKHVRVPSQHIQTRPGRLPAVLNLLSSDNACANVTTVTMGLPFLNTELLRYMLLVSPVAQSIMGYQETSPFRVSRTSSSDQATRTEHRSIDAPALFETSQR